jgi:hypothetical protein
MADNGGRGKHKNTLMDTQTENQTVSTSASRNKSTTNTVLSQNINIL